MVIAPACAFLALAVLCSPGSPTAARLRRLVPRDAMARRTGEYLPMAALTVVPAGLAGFLLAGAGGAAALVVIVVTVRRRRAARLAAADTAATASEVADALRRVTDELRTGAHPAVALDGIHADGPRARAVLLDTAAAARLGDDVPAALRREAARRPAVAADLTRIAESWALAERHGIPLADLLAGAQSTIAWRVQFGRRVQAQLAGPRATAAVLTALPGLGLLLGQLLGADPLGVIRSGALGQLLLVVGVALGAIGVAWTEHILRSAVPR